MDEVENLILSLRDGKVQTRRDAAYLLGEKGDSRAIPALSQALQDNDKFVCARARDSLRQLDVPVEDEVISTKWNRPIAAMEMIGGVLGVLVSVSYLDGVSLSLEILLITALFVGFYMLSFFAGWYLWKNRPRGLSFSMLVQALQIPTIRVPGLIYLLVSPLAVLLYIRVDLRADLPYIGFGWNLHFPSMWSLYIGETVEQLLLGANIVSLACLFYLRKQSKNKSSLVPSDNLNGQEM